MPSELQLSEINIRLANSVDYNSTLFLHTGKMISIVILLHPKPLIARIKSLKTVNMQPWSAMITSNRSN